MSFYFTSVFVNVNFSSVIGSWIESLINVILVSYLAQVTYNQVQPLRINYLAN